MNIIKRNGTTEEVDSDKIYKRIRYLVNAPYRLKNVDILILTQKVKDGLYDGIHTSEIDVYSADLAASMAVQHREYGVLAGRIVISNHQKKTLSSFKDKMDKLYLRQDVHGVVCSLLDSNFYKFVKKNQKAIEKRIDYSRDFLLDFFAFKTLEKSYLMKCGNEIIERPQDIFMRVAIFLHMNSKAWKSKEVLDRVFETYDYMSQRYFTHATPTLFNAGSTKPQLLSCFLIGSEDSAEGILKTVTDCALISKASGGIGFHFDWRSKGALIRGTNGSSDGAVPFLKIFDDTARAFNQGGGKRKGSFAAYIEPHNPDILDVLKIRRPIGDENLRCPDLFIALWISDLFMKRLIANEMWSLFDSDRCPGLSDCYGEEYEKLYHDYEEKKLYSRQIPAREILNAAFLSQKETGIPYVCFKDTVNRSNNQSNIGVIKSSNLCSEIVEYSSADEYACCSLSSVCLPMFVEDTFTEEELALPERRELDHVFPLRPVFNYRKLEEIVMIVTRNLNQVVDRNWYPVPETKRSNMRHRPLGIGVQGLADVFFKFKTTYDSEIAADLNRRIFETIYYAALSASTKLSREIYLSHLTTIQEKGSVTINKITYDNQNSLLPKTIGAYSTFEGSPLSEGQFHFEMRGLTTKDCVQPYDWETLRSHIQAFGTRNSLLVALMPTGSTSQIMGNTEGIDPLTSNIYSRDVLSGSYLVINKYLIHDLDEIGMWNDQVRECIKRSGSSIQSIEGLPQELKDRYRTVWELPQKSVIDLAADRQHFVDQSQSMNLYVADLTLSKTAALLTYGWKKGVKTGCYYLHSRPAADPQKFTVDPSSQTKEVQQVNYIPTLSDETQCLSCSG